MWFFNNNTQLLLQIEQMLITIEQKENAIMAAQDDVNAAAATLVSLTNTLGTVAGDLNAAVAKVQAEIDQLKQANPAVDTSALNDAVNGLAAPLAALQSADTAVQGVQ